MSVDPDNAIALAALDELAKTRAALVAALGGEDAMPAGTTLPMMVDALAQMNRFYHRGWGASHIRHQRVKRLLREHGIEPEVTSTPVREPLSRASWVNVDPPAIRWVSDGEGAGFYVWVSSIQRWQWTGVDGGGIFNLIVKALPEGRSEQLFCWADVRTMLNEYRDIRAAGLTDISNQRHSEVLDEIWLLMLDASDWPMIAADSRYERERES